MKSKPSDAKVPKVHRQGSFNDTILQLFERADESTRMDMYMTYRDMRESFEMVEVSTSPWSAGADLTCRNSKLHLF